MVSADSIYQEGKKAYYDGRYDVAISILDSCLKVIDKLSDEPTKLHVSAEQRLGNSARKARRYGKADLHLHHALEMSNSVYGEGSDRSAGVMLDLGSLYEARGMYTRSLEWTAKCKQITERLHGPGSKKMAYIKMNDANTYYAMGNYSKSISMLYEVPKIYQKTLKEDDQNFNRVFLTMSNCYRKKGDLNTALEFAQKALNIKLLNYHEEHPSVPKYIEAVAKILVELGEIEEARIYFKRSEESIRARGNFQKLGANLNNAARIYQAKGEIKQALVQYRRALTMNEQVGKPTDYIKYNVAMCLYDLGEREEAQSLLLGIKDYQKDPQILLRLSKWALRGGNVEKAHLYSVQAKKVIPPGDDFRLIKHMVNEAKILATTDLDSSWQRINEAITYLTEMRMTYEGQDSKNYINEELDYIFDFSVALGLQRYNASEQNPSAASDLFQIIEQAKAASFWDDYSEDNANYYGGVPPELLEEIEILKAEGIDQRASLEAKMDLLRTKYPKYFQKKYSLDVPALDEVQAKLPPGLALLDYYLRDDEVICMLLSHDEVKVLQYKLEETFHFDNELLLLSEEIRRITIVPHGRIHMISFDQLRHPDSGDFLLEKYAFSYQVNVRGIFTEPSAESRMKYLGFSPKWEGNEMLAAEGGENRDMLLPLPGAREEIADVSELFKGTVLNEGMASEEAFYESVSDYDLIHFATHASVDPENELNSVLFLHSDAASGDGRLEMDEIMKTEVNANLVLLSACETGAGLLKTGEGVMSLARAFQYAGAKSVFMSLWRANDQSAHPIVLDFIRNYKSGMTKDVALQKSKLKYLETADPLLRNEFYWAGFVVSGDLSAYPRSNRWWISIVVLLSLASLLLLIYKFR